MTIDFRVIARQLGLLLLVLSALILSMTGFAVVEQGISALWRSPDARAMLLSAAVGIILALALVGVGKRSSTIIGHREALLLVAMSWIVGGFVAALPFRCWAAFRPEAGIIEHDFDFMVNCYFESISGLTTTGSTIVQAIGTLPRSILLWRSLIQWLGGLGIVVLFVAVLPMLGVGGRRIYRIEAPGPSPEGVKPRIVEAARALWYIYLGLTLAEIVALRIAGMSWFDATCHTLTTLATGGFSTLDASAAGFPSPSIQYILMFFMLLAGMNFGLYHLVLRGEWRKAIKDHELRCYLALVFIATVVIAVSVYRNDSLPPTDTGHPAGVAAVVQHSLFQVLTIQTTTGFCSTDFDTWSFVPKAILISLMFVGGCAGSTGGGIKVIRVMIAAKVMVAEIEHVYRPKVVRMVKIGKTTIDADLKRSILVYVLGILLLFAMGTGGLMYFDADSGIDITTAATASASTLNNIGPGLARVGATHNYAWFSAPSKIVMCMLMILGRLEMFTIIVLFTPRYWRGE